jgi:hypothetical protein
MIGENHDRTADRPSADTRCASVDFNVRRRKPAEALSMIPQNFRLRNSRGNETAVLLYLAHMLPGARADGQRVEFRIFLPYSSRLLRSPNIRCLSVSPACVGVSCRSSLHEALSGAANNENTRARKRNVHSIRRQTDERELHYFQGLWTLQRRSLQSRYLLPRGYRET